MINFCWTTKLDFLMCKILFSIGYVFCLVNGCFIFVSSYICNKFVWRRDCSGLDVKEFPVSRCLKGLVLIFQRNGGMTHKTKVEYLKWSIWWLLAWHSYVIWVFGLSEGLYMEDRCTTKYWNFSWDGNWNKVFSRRLYLWKLRITEDWHVQCQPKDAVVRKWRIGNGRISKGVE